jgi:glycine betaine/choline ABC-type transport system substrate-binding protein
VVLEDDRAYFPPYDAVPIVNEASLKAHPAIASVLGALAGRVAAAAMRRHNLAVDGGHRAPAAVAREFLHSVGLGGKP